MRPVGKQIRKQINNTCTLFRLFHLLSCTVQLHANEVSVKNVETDNIFVQHSDLLMNLLMSNFSKFSVHTLFLLMKLGTHGSGPHPHQRYY